MASLILKIGLCIWGVILSCLRLSDYLEALMPDLK